MHLGIKIRSSAKTLALPVAGALVLALGVGAAPAHAQQARTFVSGLGSDANAPNDDRPGGFESPAWKNRRRAAATLRPSQRADRFRLSMCRA